MADRINILWVDDEIDLLKPHILFLNRKGYEVYTATNGGDALDMIKARSFDIVFLDEHMPGLSGIETLSTLKDMYPTMPVVMITKSEEERIMEDAIGSNITDYLIKPVNPNQILAALKKSLENKKIISEKTTSAYQQEFRTLGMEISNNLDPDEWVEVYRKLVSWELRLEKSADENIQDVLKMQKAEANQVFARFIEKNYLGWVNGTTKNRPILSHTLLREKLFPLLDSDTPVFFVLIDNMRYDQWKIIQPVMEEYFRTEREEMFYSILPSTTQYSRNALFAGLMPSEIEKKYPKYWVYEGDEGTKNQYEEELLLEYLRRFGKDVRLGYHKVLNLNAGRKLAEAIPNLMVNKLNVIVYNFVDMLSHARTEMEIIKELADDEPAYRSLTLSWFHHSPLLEIIQQLAQRRVVLIITTDHGSVRVQNPIKVVGDKNTTTNLRYKTGRSLDFNSREVFEVRNPADAFLPRGGVSASFIFSRKNDFFAYPNNYNYYVNYFRNTFQHGGISLEELIIPFTLFRTK